MENHSSNEERLDEWGGGEMKNMGEVMGSLLPFN